MHKRQDAAIPLSAPAKRHLLEVVGKVHDAIGPTPAQTEVKRMLNASVAAEAATEIGHYLADLASRAKAAGRLSQFGVVGATLWSDGCGTITTSATPVFGSSDRPFIQAVEAAESWIVRDEVAEINETFGLNSDGTYSDGAA